MSQEKIYPGQGVRVSASIRDPRTGQLVDPSTVSLTFRDPSGLEHAAVVDQEETGKYSGVYVVDESGVWYWRMVSEVPGAAAEEGSFKVEPSKFTT